MSLSNPIIYLRKFNINCGSTCKNLCTLYSFEKGTYMSIVYFNLWYHMPGLINIGYLHLLSDKLFENIYIIIYIFWDQSVNIVMKMNFGRPFDSWLFNFTNPINITDFSTEQFHYFNILQIGIYGQANMIMTACMHAW